MCELWATCEGKANLMECNAISHKHVKTLIHRKTLHWHFVSGFQNLQNQAPHSIAPCINHMKCVLCAVKPLPPSLIFFLFAHYHSDSCLVHLSESGPFLTMMNLSLAIPPSGMRSEPVMNSSSRLFSDSLNPRTICQKSLQ